MESKSLAGDIVDIVDKSFVAHRETSQKLSSDMLKSLGDVLKVVNEQSKQFTKVAEQYGEFKLDIHALNLNQKATQDQQDKLETAITELVKLLGVQRDLSQELKAERERNKEAAIITKDNAKEIITINNDLARFKGSLITLRWVATLTPLAAGFIAYVAGRSV